MTENTARQQAQAMAKGRSVWYDVVRTKSGFDYFPRYSDTQGRTDKGDVVATFNSYGQRVDVEHEA